MGRVPRWVQPVGGGIVVAVLLWRVGPSLVLDAVARIDGWTLLAGSLLALITTACTSWRWVLVARGLGLRLSLRGAMVASYRSQFLNVSLPGGVAGDVHRGVAHGRDTGDVGRAVRAVVWERTAGQAVQVCLAIVALLAVPSPVRRPVVAIAAGLTVGAVALVLTSLAARRGRSAIARVMRSVSSDVRSGLLGRTTWPGVVGASTVAVAGHVATFLLAARSAGAAVAPLGLVPLAFIVLLAMAIPLNLAGWGPREGAAAWVFGASGLGAVQGVSTAVVYGGMVLVASLPGAAILAISGGRFRGKRARGGARG